MLLKLIISLLFVLFFFYLRYVLVLKRKKKVFKVKKLVKFNKKNLNNWMNLTKKERYDLSKEESITYLNKRKVLLGEIRKEYKRISEEKSKE